MEFNKLHDCGTWSICTIHSSFAYQIKSNVMCNREWRDTQTFDIFLYVLIEMFGIQLMRPFEMLDYCSNHSVDIPTFHHPTPTKSNGNHSLSLQLVLRVPSHSRYCTVTSADPVPHEFRKVKWTPSHRFYWNSTTRWQQRIPDATTTPNSFYMSFLMTMDNLLMFWITSGVFDFDYMGDDDHIV